MRAKPATEPPADPFDAMCAPEPAGGWSTAVRSVERAVATHARRGYLVHASGVFDADGRYVHEAVHWRGRPLMVPPPPPEAAESLPGRWLWGGVLHDHFGHFLMESTGRLWALPALEGALDGIVYLPERGFGRRAADRGLAPFQRLFLDLLGVRLPVRILDRPTRIDLLEVPGQGFGIGPMVEGTAPFRAFVRDRFARDVAPEGPARLYVSRSTLDLRLGGILGEKRLETYLADEGYEVFHPQAHPLPEQIARYRAATRVVGPDGSALHLFAMTGTADQPVAVLKRRSGRGAHEVLRHLGAFTGRDPVVIDAIARNWIRSDRGRVDNFSYGELDFARLGEALAAAGFVAPGRAWTSVPSRRIRRQLDGMEARLARKGLTFRPDDAG